MAASSIRVPRRTQKDKYGAISVTKQVNDGKAMVFE